MKSYTKLTIIIYVIELGMISMFVGGIYYFTKQILDINPELITSGIGMFGAGFLAHKYLSMKWKENKDKIFKIN